MSKLKESIVLLLGTCGVVVAVLATCGTRAADPAQADKVGFRLNWQPYAEHVAYYLALEKGYYSDVDLDVDITVGTGSGDSVKLVAADEVEFALAAGGNVIQARSAGMPILVVAVIYQDDPTAFTVLKDSGIRDLDDLLGKKIGVAFDSSTYPEYLALIERNALDRTQLIEVPVSFGVQPLLTGQVDAFPGFLTQVPIVVKSAGYEPATLCFKDYGVNIYGVSIITTEKLATENPEMVGRFVEASLRGWDYTFSHQEEAVEIMISRFPELDRADLLAELELLIPLIQTDMTRQRGLGFSEELRWQDAVEILFEQSVIEEKIDHRLLFTNQFLP